MEELVGLFDPNLGNKIEKVRCEAFKIEIIPYFQEIDQTFCLVERLSNRKILPKIGLTGQFCFENCPTRQIRLYVYKYAYV